MYLTYTEYTNFGGSLSEELFGRFSYRAEKEVDNKTFDRCKNLAKVPEEVKRCVFELVEYLSKNAKNGSALAISSFGNDGYSISYNDKKTAEQQIYDIIYTYLADTDLMYCGVG